MLGLRKRLFSFLTDLAIRAKRNRPDDEDLRRRLKQASYRTDMSGLGVRMTSFLRDRLRRGWLRIRRED